MKQKIWYIFGTVCLVLLIELYFLISLPQQIRASTNPPNSDGCSNFLTVTTSESTCNANYMGTYHIQSKGQPFTVQFTTQGYYCTNPHPMEGSQAGRPVCLENGSVMTGSRNIGAGGATDISVAAPIRNACGSAQTDLSFDAFQNGQRICSYGNPNFVFGWSFCTTNMTCEHPTPTPTAVPTAIPTPTPTVAPLTPTPTPTPIVIIVTSTPPPPTIQTTTQQETACSNITQNGTNTNINCQVLQQQQNNTQNSSQNGTQTQTQTQNNTSTSTTTPFVPPVVAVAAPPAPATQQVLAAATVAPAPQASQLPSTGGEGEVLLGLLGLIPIGIKLRNIK